MDVLIRTDRATSPDGGAVLIHEYRAMVDHSPLRNGTDWLPGARRFELGTGEPVRRIDEITYQLATTGEILKA